jgi:ABC-type multidrug transport system fused ATPase/permease subunit
VAAISVAALSGCAEALGLMALMPLLNQRDPSWETLWPILLMLASFLVAATFLKLAADALVSTVTTRVEARARKELTERLIFAPWPQVGRLGQGEVTAAVMSESTQVSNGVYAFLSGASSLVVVFILFISAAVVTPALLGVTVVFILVSILVFRIRLRYVRMNERSIAETTANVGEEISSALGEIKFLRESGSDRSWLKSAWTNADELARLRRRQILLPSVTRSMIDSVAAIFLAIVVALAVLWLDDIALGLVFVALFYRIIPRVQAVQTSFNTAHGQAEWIKRWDERISSLGGSRPLEASALSSQEPHEVLEIGDMRPPHIQFAQVSHTYTGRETPVLKNVSLEIGAMEKVAFVGASGSGKTTLLDLMLGLFPPSSGQVLIDGLELDADGWRRFRSGIGIVPQEVPLRRGSLADNVYWDRVPDKVQLHRALKIAQLTTFVSELPDAEESFIDSKSIGLSGGQRQRIGLARALFRRPGLLVLDEGTSALDVQTERALLDALDNVDWDMTVVIVTHRPTALANVQRTVELVRGEIKES